MSKSYSLKAMRIIIDGHMYRVMDLPRSDVEEFGPNILQKGVAYRIKTDMTNGLFPYRGIIKKSDHWNPYAAKPGIYLKERSDHRYLIKIAYPRDKKTRTEYDESNIKDILAAVMDNEYAPDQFINLKVNETKGDAFMPPVRVDDDYLNKLVKVGIRLKEAPFDYYGKRLEASAADKSKKIEGVNVRNNTKRMLKNNSTLSPNKSKMVTDNWQMELAVILRDSPGAIDPMFPEDDSKMLIVYPSGIPFDINKDKLINATDLINEAIADSKDIATTDDDDDMED